MSSRRIASLGAAAALAAAVLAAGQLASGHPLASARRCPVFPKSNQWNLPVDKLPLAGNSAAMVRSIGIDRPVHADFGSGNYNGGPIGIPYITVSGRAHKTRVSFDYSDESDKGPYPIPKNVPIEGGRNASGDRHAIIVDRSRCRLYELYALQPTSGGGWHAGSGAIWNLRSNRLRPRDWTSADAAGLPILPGLARYDEVRRGSIDHALRFTVPDTRKAFVYPARHFASSDTDPNLPAMGQRFRLRASFDTSGFPKQARIVLKALKRYGMIVADNGSSWFISGAPARGWNNDDLHTLGKVTGSDFEAVDTSSLPRP
ncbi:MAG TPA: hypothetical protein VH256_05740 [Thermoleophilaceae bacterium]|nr:hypothetical protein [Thermoleophilaceae bacterium]